MPENKIIENRLAQYKIHSKQDELNALKEIFQEIALSALSRTEFFKQAGFQGGTCLRIFYGLQRFSEDLDFALKGFNPTFNWEPFLHKIHIEFESYGLNLEIKNRSETEGSVRKAFLKEDSFGQVLNLSYTRDVSDVQKILIKLEVDTNPPSGSEYDAKLLDFPIPSSVTLHSLDSLFSGKCHALLCRPYCKGRDWFDFIWYVTQKIQINLVLLKNALYQSGPWQTQNISVNKNWLLDVLSQIISNIDWNSAREDVKKFLRPREQEMLSLWNKDFFAIYLDKLDSYL